MGHIIPGIALALAAWREGLKIVIATYSQGYEFLRQHDQLDFDYELVRLTVPDSHKDWPGICPYDNGVQELIPLVRRTGAELCFFVGEYIVGPLLASLSCTTVSLFNPEILIDTPKNQDPSAYLCRMIAQSDYVIPLAPVPEGHELIAEMDLIVDRIIATGPFVFPLPAEVAGDAHRPLILIANGGGIQFPATTDSYSSTGISPDLWIQESYEYTRAAIQAALEMLKGDGEIHVYSCLGKEHNQLLQALGDRDVLHVNNVSPEFYRYLPQADLVVSRSGIGFLADIEQLDCYRIIWALCGHDEQALNAQAFVQQHDKAYFCNEPQAMHELFSDIQRGLTGFQSQPPMHRRDRAGLAISELLKCL
ncbi:MAG: glycosyltransferase [Sedimenticola sp.]